MDKSAVRDALRTFAPVALFGHEHSTRAAADRRGVHLFAGAVQPCRRDPATWLPTYHILQLSIGTTAAKRELIVRVHTREFTTDAPYRFRPRRNEQELTVEEHRIELPAPKESPATRTISVARVPDHALSLGHAKSMSTTEPKTLTPAEMAQHELLVHFFRLRTPQRYEAAFKAGLLRDGDDALDPQVMWAEVFRRAGAENKLRDFWATVAAQTPAIRERPNPFHTPNHA